MWIVILETNKLEVMNRIRLIAVLAMTILAIGAFAQKDSLWHLSPSSSTEPGIDWQKSNDLMQGKEATQVVVAVIDDGVNVNHPDLLGSIWTNSGEIADNGIDDDKNGYVDDLYGWNFIGTTKGDNLEKARFLGEERKRYAAMKKSDRKKDEKYEEYKSLSKEMAKEAKRTDRQAKFVGRMDTYVTQLYTTHGDTPSLKQVRSIRAKKFAGKTAKLITKKIVKKQPSAFESFYSQIQSGAKQLKFAASYHYNTELDERKSNVGDNYGDVTEQFYGDNRVNYHSSGHGTHVAGIIAANAQNNFGAKGICGTCKIMSIRTVPDGDERDKDVANSIRYAVDNGAQIINMSFGKSMSPDAKTVSEAIQYAEDNNVLLVHAAGNESSNHDRSNNFPNDANVSGSNWIEVGASSYGVSPKRLAVFSNYGKAGVDLFAPGDQIYSTYTSNGYEPASGTSMASPVVAGVAAYVLSFYPDLSAAELKNILMQSVTPLDEPQRIPGSKEETTLSELSVSGGVVNLYRALILAEEVANR